MDGIDVALIRSDGEARVETGPAATFGATPRAWRSACARSSPTRGRRKRRRRTSNAT